MKIDINEIMAVVNTAANGGVSGQVQPKEKAFNEARIEIVSRLLVQSYIIMGIRIPADDIIMTQAAIIAENADISNYHMKWAFVEAVKRKQYDEVRTPITYRDLEVAINLATSQSVTYSGKAYKRLPKLTDKELWGEKVCYLASNFEQIEFEKMKKQELIGYSRQG